jgi:hypothetical protein
MVENKGIEQCCFPHDFLEKIQENVGKNYTKLAISVAHPIPERGRAKERVRPIREIADAHRREDGHGQVALVGCQHVLEQAATAARGTA